MEKAVRFVLVLWIGLVQLSCTRRVGVEPISTISPSPVPSLSATASKVSPMPFIDTSHENIVMETPFGIYLVYDIDEQRSYEVTLPAVDCVFARRLWIAICQTNNGLVSVDIQTGLQTALPIPPVRGWELTTGERSLFYNVDMGDVEFQGEIIGDIYELYRFDLKRNTIEDLGPLNTTEGLGELALSNLGGHLASVRGIGESHRASELYEIMPDGTYQRIGPDLVLTVEELTWSPTDEILGITASDLFYDESLSDQGPNCTTTRFITYRWSTQEVRQVSQAPIDTCFQYTYHTSSNIWSPDGRRVVLKLIPPYGQTEDEELCVVEIDSASQRCLAVVLPEEWITQVAWSPDSLSLAYLVANRSSRYVDLRMISADGGTQTVLLANILGVWEITGLVWIGARR